MTASDSTETCVSVALRHHCTFLTAESDPAVEAAAAATASVTLAVVVALAALRAVRPETIHPALWNTEFINSGKMSPGSAASTLEVSY